jgi:pimeloyl-ACP methyl ester carboxylesterase
MDGDYAEVTASGDAYFARTQGGGYDSYLPTLNLTLCANELHPKDSDALLELALAPHRVPFVGPLDAFSQAACTIAPPSDDAIQQIATAQAVGPILLLQAEHDFATPLRAATDLHESLDNSVLVTWDSAQHATYFNSACMHDIGVAFLLDGAAPKWGLTCFD